MDAITHNPSEEVKQTTIDPVVNPAVNQSTVNNSATELNAAHTGATDHKGVHEATETNIANTNNIKNTTNMANTINSANAVNSATVVNSANVNTSGTNVTAATVPTVAESVTAQLATMTRPELKAISNVMVACGMLTPEMVGSMRSADELTSSGLITAPMVRDAMMIAGVGMYAANGPQAAPELAVPGPATIVPVKTGICGPATAKTGVAAGRVTKKKSVATPTKLSTKANTQIDNALNNVLDSGPSTPTNTTPGLLIGKASGPTCINCRKNKARCDRVVTCVKCAKAGVDCEVTSAGNNKNKGMDKKMPGGPGSKTPTSPIKLKACDRCKRMKSACVRKDKCVRCDKRGEECVVG